MREDKLMVISSIRRFSRRWRVKWLENVELSDVIWRE